MSAHGLAPAHRHPSPPAGCCRFALWKLGPYLTLGVCQVRPELATSTLSRRLSAWAPLGTAFLVVDGLSLPRFVTIQLGETPIGIDLLIGVDLLNLST